MKENLPNRYPRDVLLKWYDASVSNVKPGATSEIKVHGQTMRWMEVRKEVMEAGGIERDGGEREEGVRKGGGREAVGREGGREALTPQIHIQRVHLTLSRDADECFHL